MTLTVGRCRHRLVALATKMAPYGLLLPCRSTVPFSWWIARCRENFGNRHRKARQVTRSGVSVPRL